MKIITLHGYKMYKLVTKRVIPLKCKRCGNKWNYAGSNMYFATCSYCKTCVNVKKQLNAPLENESEIGSSDSSSKVAQTTETPTSEFNG
jgi:late competence protein required for DNA uptake (superfamily II DNA/RNA helicase)